MRRALDEFDATLDSHKWVAFGLTPGLEFHAKIAGEADFGGPGQVLGRIYLFNTRVYELTVAAREDRVTMADPERFLASFQWLDPDPNDNDLK
jgi:hypothetical protein